MKTLSIEQINSIAKDMKYEALYWALGFEESETGLFRKEYSAGCQAEINANEQLAIFKEINSGYMKIALKSHESFVVLECINLLLEKGCQFEKISLAEKKCTEILYRNFRIKCFEWGHIEKNFSDSHELPVMYSSRLVSGVIEREYSVKGFDGSIYSGGLFENDKIGDESSLENPKKISSNDFEIIGTTVKKYLGNSKIVRIPEGVLSLAPCLFWDNQQIEEVILPQSLISLGGDTFYNCKNLKKITIPKKVRFMGNNPFAGCPILVLKNESESFNLEDGVLYSKDFSRLIYYPISAGRETYEIKNSTKVVGKHAFFMCDNLKKITIPSLVIKLENNPFSGCEHLELENHSSRYNVCDSVIYDSDFSSVIGCLNSIDTDELVLKDVKRICRNSFWNCKKIKKIILPETLETIGYNPFVGCGQIEFASNSANFKVENGILFNSDKSKIICFPKKFAVGEVHIPETVTSLERGAFSGCSEMKAVHLHNISIISKTCFTNCDSLEKIYCPDLVSYIGEWAFAHCKNLREISVHKDCFIDKNVILNSPAQIKIRDERTNYVIESDNLHTLKTMQTAYEGKIKSILIDPPYNSHIDYIGYKDGNFGGGYVHFIEERFVLAHKLLTDDGFLVVNIDEGGVGDIVNVCEKIFGVDNVCVKKWKKKHEFFDVNRVERNPNKIQTDFEYIVFARKTCAARFNKIMQPYLEAGKLLEKDGMVPEIFDCFGTNSSAKDEIARIFGQRDYFSTPKPLKLMKELVRATTKKESIVLDFFAGSGTTGHAVTELNREDGGKRSFILISNSESDICKNVTMKRMNFLDAEFVGLV